MARHKFDKAKSILEQALQTMPNDARLHSDLGAVFFELWDRQRSSGQTAEASVPVPEGEPPADVVRKKIPMLVRLPEPEIDWPAVRAHVRRTIDAIALPAGPVGFAAGMDYTYSDTRFDADDQTGLERLAATAGAGRELLVPLVRAAVENWAAHGPERALTGPVARGDESTVARQRAAVAERTPDLLPLFDALTDATRALAARAAGVPA